MNSSGMHASFVSFISPNCLYFERLIYPLFNCRSIDCFRLGWPMRADADFFCLSIEQLREKNGVSIFLDL